MREDFLHYIWKYKKFDVLNLKTSCGLPIQILNSGNYLELSGPDFFNAQLVLGDQKWAGNVEIHLKSSDWYVHHHEKDKAYDNVVLHVVWEHDISIFRGDNSEIPTLELKNFITEEVIDIYKDLSKPKSWIFCEKDIASVNDFVFENWKERLFFERLEQKSVLILELLKKSKNDWENVLFCLLMKNFGLNTNGANFFEIAQSIPFAVVRKESTDYKNLEALFFGQANLLSENKEDAYYKDLQFRYYYLVHKYQLVQNESIQLQFFKHRPDNFPTIRLAQLVQLYFTYQNLFSKIISISKIEDLYDLFHISAFEYWDTHYVFDKISPSKLKKITHSFVDLLIINTIVPLRFVYDMNLEEPNTDVLLDFIKSIDSEKNSVVEKFKSFKIKVDNAYDSQALLQLKNEYCTQQKCLNCAIGKELLKFKS